MKDEKGPFPIYIGCAGWNVRYDNEVPFPKEGSHLERFAAVFPAVEINSSFYRSHRPDTYARWASTVPTSFRFSVKIPKTISHECGLVDCVEELQTFVDEVRHLGTRLGCLLLQLPPSFAFTTKVARQFFKELRSLTAVPIVCEPRHKSWFAERAESLLQEFAIAQVAADPALTPKASQPGGAQTLAYYRLHGSPNMYYSAYSADYIRELASQIKVSARARPTWCIFDNTAAGAAVTDAFRLLTLT